MFFKKKKTVSIILENHPNGLADVTLEELRIKHILLTAENLRYKIQIRQLNDCIVRKNHSIANMKKVLSELRPKKEKAAPVASVGKAPAKLTSTTTKPKKVK